jgi:4-diphosphocytidyl-2-C-methyl-D-erythritol kinase
LPDEPRQWVVLVVPPFGVSTKEAYGWFDAATLKGSPYRRFRRSTADGAVAGRPFQGRRRNDLQAPVVEHHPEIGQIIRRLKRLGAAQAAMSGSGSAVFGLFQKQAAAEAAAGAMAGGGRRSIVTRTIARGEYRRLAAPRLARK